MKITIIGNLGYVGPVVVSHLKQHIENLNIRGIDNGLFQYCYLDHMPGSRYECDEQIHRDARLLVDEDLYGSDVVVYLAAISNDPMGTAYKTPTFEINQDAAIRAALLCDKLGIDKFIFASSCSVYGSRGTSAKTEESALEPLTSYAESKINTENELRNLNLSVTKVVCLRFATACGQSPRIRLDLALNDFVASAVTLGKIDVLSDGSPWRPLIDVEDMANFIRLVALDHNLPQHLVLNAGYNVANYQVKELAQAVSRVTDAEVTINHDAMPDRRSYKVDFSNIQSRYNRDQPIKKLDESILDLVELYAGSDSINGKFRDSKWIRLNYLKFLKDHGFVADNLGWK